MRNLKQFLFAFLALGFASIAAPIHADSKGDAPISYTVKRGDTLIRLAQKYLTNSRSYRIIQRDNRIRNPRFLPVGKKLLIRRSLLKYRPANARILSVRGNVTVRAAGRRAKARTGQVIAEGARLSTSGSSFVTLGLANGSRISLPSNSDVKIRLLRTYALGGSLDYDFDILRGGTRSKVVPHKSKNDRYRVRTPKAVSAVRGTDFQARYDADTGRDFAEVIEGKLNVAAAGGDISELPAGQGLAMAQDGAITRESLLAEPQLVEPGKMQVNPVVSFSANPATGEAGYRVTLAKDAGFVDQIADIVLAGKKANFSDIDNGNYFVRARAVSAAGIQGNPVTFAFKRRLNGVRGSAGASDDGYDFKWLTQGDGKRSFHFQLFQNELGGLAMVDEPALQADKISISDLPAGDYFWRVGAVQYLDNEVTTNWTTFEKLSVAP